MKEVKNKIKSIDCKKVIVNFKNQPMFPSNTDGSISKKPWTVGIYLCDLLLLSQLEPTDDPVHIYKLAKRLYNEKTVEIDKNDSKTIIDLLKGSMQVPTIIKGQLLELIPTYNP